MNKLDKALSFYQQALTIQKRLIKTNPEARLHLSGTYNNLGVYYFYLGDDEESRAAYLQALKIAEVLAKENPLAYNNDLAKSLLNLAISYAKAKAYVSAKPYFEKAVEIYSNLVVSNPDAFNPKLELTHYNFAILLQNSGEILAAQHHFYKALDILESLYTKYPSAHLRRFALCLNKLSGFYLNFAKPPNKQKAATLAKKVLTICTPQIQKKEELKLPYNTAIELLKSCGENVDAYLNQ